MENSKRLHPPIMLTLLCVFGSGCVLDRTGQSASALYQTHQNEQRVRMSNLESQIDNMDGRIGHVEEYNRSRGQTEIRKMENLEELREELARMRGEIEVLQHEFDQSSLNEMGRASDTDYRMLWLEDRAEKLETALGMSPPPPPDLSSGPEEILGQPDVVPGVDEASTPGEVKAATGPNIDGGTESEAGTATGAVPDETSARENPSESPEGAAIEEQTAPKIDPLALLRLAESHLSQGKEVEARAALDRFVELYPEHDRLPQALYRKAESYFNEGDYGQAANGFKIVVDRYRESKWAPYSMLRQGECFEALDRSEDALAFYNALVQLWPKSRAAKEARQKIEQMK